MEYILVTGSASQCADTSKLNEAVNIKITEGFKIFGNPGLSFDPTTGIAVYYQAMTKE